MLQVLLKALGRLLLDGSGCLDHHIATFVLVSVTFSICIHYHVLAQYRARYAKGQPTGPLLDGFLISPPHA